MVRCNIGYEMVIFQLDPSQLHRKVYNIFLFYFEDLLNSSIKSISGCLLTYKLKQT